MDWNKWESGVAPGGMVAFCYERRWLRKLRCIAHALLVMHKEARSPAYDLAIDFVRRSIDRRRDLSEKQAILELLAEEYGVRALAGDLDTAAGFFAIGVLEMGGWELFTWLVRTLVEGTVHAAYAPSPGPSTVETATLVRTMQFRQIRKEHAEVISDIVRNPFAAGSPEIGFPLKGSFGKFIHDTAVGVYERGEPADIAALHDALLEGGCECAEVINHLDSRKIHYPGCWVVDMILAKSPR